MSLRNLSFVYMFILSLILSGILRGQGEIRNLGTMLDSIYGQYDIGIKPGVSIAIIQDDKPTFFKSYGYANLEYGIQNTSNTLYNATDLAKQFTVFSMLLLEDQGKLSIDDNVKDYLPFLSDWPFDITLKHLMEQTSGLRDVKELKKWSAYENGDVVTKQNILDIIAKQRSLNFSPGSKFEYNRTGFVLLSEVVAKVSGISFAEFVKQNIFEPLGMQHSVFVDSHTELIPNRSYSYDNAEDKYIKILNNSSFVGGTNLYTSTADFAKWLRNMTNLKIGKASYYEYMYTHIELSNGEKSNYTPGIFKDDSNGYWRIHLEGFDHGYSGYMMYLPKYDFSLILFSNDIDFPLHDIFDPLYEWFDNEYSVPESEPFLASKVLYVNISSEELETYTGGYVFDDNYIFREIILENDTLIYKRSEDNRTAMVPIAEEHTFKMLYTGSDNIRVSFKDDRNILEFTDISSDYKAVGRKVEYEQKKNVHFSGDYRNAELAHTVKIHNRIDGIQLTINGTSIILDQIAADEFLPQQSDHVKHVKIKRDNRQNVIGLYLSGFQLKDLYYELVKEPMR